MASTLANNILVRASCRACQGELREVLNLGNLKLNAFPEATWELEKVPASRLILVVCRQCGLAQLDRTVPPDWMYRQYWYRSGVNEMMVRELRAIVQEATQLAKIKPGAIVMDIGANDGTLLSMYPKFGCTPHRVAIEPALNLTGVLKKHAETVFPNYFPLEAAESYNGRCAIVTAIAMAYDLEDPRAFFQALHDLLAPGGVAVLQFQDFTEQIHTAAFDNICHEHLEYYTLWSLTHLFMRTGLTMQRVSRTPINGGSLRVVLRRAQDGIAGDPSVSAFLAQEAAMGLDTVSIRNGDYRAFDLFRERVDRAKTQIAAVLHQAFMDDLVVDVYGASTKGNILLQVMGLGGDRIRQAIDRSPEKVGHMTITGIPIVGEEKAREAPADIWLTPIWQFRPSVLEREGWYLEQGGTIIFPLPQVEVMRQTWTAVEQEGARAGS